MRGHHRVSERQRISDKFANHRGIAIFENVSRYVEFGTDLPACFIDRVAREALNTKDLESAFGWGIVGHAFRTHVRKLRIECDQLDTGQLPRSRMRVEVLLLGLDHTR